MIGIKKRKTTTSTEVKQRWMAKAYNRYQVNLRKDDDAKLIEYVEANKETIGTTQIFREALSRYLEGD